MKIYNKEYLLSDEMNIKEEDWIERELLVEEIDKLPIEAITQLRHFQPQIGCLNTCLICSQLAGNTTVYWNEERQRNIIAALKYVSLKNVSLKNGNKFPLIAYNRYNHRPGVIFSYLDNDIGNYFYLDKFVSLLYKELGVKTRISTVGYSRHNEKLNIMHTNLNSPELIDGLGGVRISFTPYAKGWNNSNQKKYTNQDYIEDIANFLKIYRPYYNYAGSGARRMCVELRYKPLVVKSKVYTFEVEGHFVLSVGNYMFISLNKNRVLREARIDNVRDHTINLDQEAEMMAVIDLYLDDYNLENLKSFVLNILPDLDKYKTAKLYKLKNSEGIYYSLNPSITEEGNYGINIYPLNNIRKKEGYLVTERFLLNALATYKSKLNMKLLDKFEDATWEDVDNVIEQIKENQKEYINAKKYEKSEYIKNEILPMVESYILMLKNSGYEASNFFDPEFTIDTGTICNLGRGYEEFKLISSTPNDPLTPTHERNYGRYNSTMTEEGITWRISCDYGNQILIQQRDLSKTSHPNGPIIFSKKIKLIDKDERLDSKDLEHYYLIPGQRKED